MFSCDLKIKIEVLISVRGIFSILFVVPVFTAYTILQLTYNLL